MRRNQAIHPPPRVGIDADQRLAIVGLYICDALPFGQVGDAPDFFIGFDGARHARIDADIVIDFIGNIGALIVGAEARAPAAVARRKIQITADHLCLAIQPQGRLQPPVMPQKAAVEPFHLNMRA